MMETLKGKRPKQPVREFSDERGGNNLAAPSHYVLRLYVTGATPASRRAIENLQEFCEKQFPGQYDLEVIDVYRHPDLARDDQVLAAPTLVKMLPLPVRRLIGDLSNREKVLRGLGLPARDKDDPK